MLENNFLLLLLFKYVPIFIVVLLLFTTMTAVQSEPNLSETKGNDETMGKSSNETANILIEPLLKFTSKLYGSKLGKDNIVLSPISIHKALNLVLLGTDRSTQTEQELINTLGFDGLSQENIIKCHEEYARILTKFKQITRDSLEVYKNRTQQDEEPRSRQKPNPPILDLFNMVITKDKGEVLPGYSEKITKYYDSSIVKIDDSKPETKRALLDKLDAWSKEAEFKNPIMTSGDLEGKFAAILLSAVRVQAFWFEAFDERDNKEIFHQYGLANKTVDGKWLYKSDIDNSKYIEFTTADKAQYKLRHSRMTSSPSAALFNELASLNFHVVEVPLEGDLSFTIFEPLNVTGSGGELDKLANQLFSSGGGSSTNGTSNIGKVLSLLDSDDASVTINLLGFPKFNFENEINLKPVLQSLGLNRAFDRTQAEISNMTQDKVFIEKIKHQAVIDVNKTGIKAAGVTTIRMSFLSAVRHQEPIKVLIKNPFIFMLRYQKIPLFIGHLVKLN